MRQRWLSRRAVLLHLSLLVWAPLCLLAFWWQVHRAFGGNTLSYLYSIEWPAFAVVGAWGWWGLVHTDPSTVGRQAQARLQAVQADAAASTGAVGSGMGATAPVRRRDQEDDALAAYNDRLADLATQGPKSWRSR
ncbi:MAG: hypothetical protein ACRDYZ_12110 [Acidimicrobiales bacterium]